MSWIFRKVFRSGPFSATLSKIGIGMSWGISGLRFGVSPSGRKYFSIGIPGTGLYFIKHLKPINTNRQVPKPDRFNKTPDLKNVKQTNEPPWWEQKHI